MARILTFGKSYLLWYAHDLINFRLQELCAIASTMNVTFEWLEEPSLNNPYILVNFASVVDVAKIMSRTVLIRSAYELWAKNSTLAELHKDLKNLPRNLIKQYCEPNVSFRIMVESFGKKLLHSYKVQKIEELVFLNFEGPINLKNPDHTFLLMEHYGTERNNVSDNPSLLFFGRWIADGQRVISQKINLKTRKFIGNTSMDPLLSLVMVNMAGVKPGDIILDPFVGTGGLLVAAAYHGAYVFGTDIDYLMLHGKAKPSRLNQVHREPDESILANLQQYGLGSQYLEAIVSDASLPLWRIPSFFDAIITDPPYGIRESTERIGSDKDYKIPHHLATDHIPSKVTYTLQDIIEDLLDFSSVYLKLNGRVVYWMPAFNDDFDKINLPKHPCLKLLSHCKQALTGHSSRFLITMVKIKENENDSDKAFVSDVASSFRQKYFQSHKQKALITRR